MVNQMNEIVPSLGAKCSRVLIIDDNPSIHEDFKKILAPKGAPHLELAQDEALIFGEALATSQPEMNTFAFDSAYQGEEGFELVKKSLQTGERYSMAFVDVRMPPGWDGVETTSKIWQIDPDLQVVICTAYSDYSWDDMLNRLGRSDRLLILKKPFDPIEVVQLANSLTRKWQLLQESKYKMANLEEMVVARTAQIVQEQEKLKSIFENSPEGIFQIGTDGSFLAANPALAAICGYNSPRDLMAELTDIENQLYTDPKCLTEFRARLERESVVRGFEAEIKCKDGSRKWISETACKVTKLDGTLLYYQGFIVDISAQKKAQRERDLMEVNLRQAQKLESVGQLAAGIAHEINTPIQYVGDNIRFITDSFGGLNGFLMQCRDLAEAVQKNSVTPEMLAAVETSGAEIDLKYLSEEIPKALQESLEGISRVATIVRAMKEFSHPGRKEKMALDLNHAIETTVLVARNEWKYTAELTTDLAPDLPLVPCLVHEFNQAMLNLIVNAAHAVGDVAAKTEGSKGSIKISTRLDGAWVEIRISDTGTGIPENIRHRIFDPFFTTKDVGKGTGQGLAIARSTVVDKHGGQINFESTVGKGTTFIIRLPICDSGNL
jgi:two-component system, NtrC family, sensor kinase